MFKQTFDFLAKVLKKEKGFTLIELLATLVIIGVIAAIAVPAIGNVIQNSKDKAKVSEALMIIEAARMAHAEHPDQTKWVSNSTRKDLEGYLEKVEDPTWIVTYASGEYSIEKHDAAPTITSEQDLIEKTK